MQREDERSGTEEHSHEEASSSNSDGGRQDSKHGRDAAGYSAEQPGAENQIFQSRNDGVFAAIKEFAQVEPEIVKEFFKNFDLKTNMSVVEGKTIEITDDLVIEELDRQLVISRKTPRTIKAEETDSEETVIPFLRSQKKQKQTKAPSLEKVIDKPITGITMEEVAETLTKLAKQVLEASKHSPDLATQLQYSQAAILQKDQVIKNYHIQMKLWHDNRVKHKEELDKKTRAQEERERAWRTEQEPKDWRFIICKVMWHN